MVRARAPGRGTSRRGTAAAGGSDGAPATAPCTAPPAATPATLDEAIASASAAASSSTSAPARRGGPPAAGARTVSGGRLRPKILRRDEVERDKLARQEEKKANDRAAAERRARGRSRNRSRRSRGDAMGARGGRGGITTASGPFSSGFAGAGAPGGGWFGGAGAGAGAGGAGYGGRGAQPDSKGKGFGQGDARRREARINADKLHVMTAEDDDELDSEDEAMMAALSSRAASTMPMGIYRRQHREQGVVVATTAELEAAEKAAAGEEESLWVDGDASGALPPVDAPEDGVWDTDAKPVTIKKEPGSEDLMDLDADIKPAPTDDDDDDDDEAQAPPPPPPLPSAKKDLPRDPEERTIQTDLDLLAGELGAVTVTDDAGGTRTEEPANKDGRLYLFQFPPLIPPLREAAADPRVKREAADLAHEHADDEPQGEQEDQEDQEDREEEEEEAEGFRSQFLPRGGAVGKLHVRRSGRVQLDWGGMTLEMSPAAGMSFLTTAVMVEESDEKAQQGAAGGESIGMGKIMGRFVLAPTWSDEEDWDVAPDDLLPPQ
ncbi:uncharacterized protein UV8b_03100 [Ustilaginoidea virens]|uniref:DNA-directed RNA polymerase III RPC4 n=1 Tax=Ustilaginoidea virens TaxID=1159556 RepID=A0A1B5L052_USTVR|nr:uncharacterized protein UV8b_03100 [Ustilaginoidea virens]QUC18859.1 hypothetical protein UV8b_03100 [Ustilaginoidea virens]GAO15779.1 hypothetical protein UVI_02021550 [Ustilaginoidea virens]